MADCSAAGTTIDRAARAVFGSGNQDATKHVSTLLGHAAMVAGNQGVVTMPISAPDHLILPGSSMPLRTHPNENRTMTDAAAVSSAYRHTPNRMMMPPMANQQYQQMEYQQMANQQYQQMAMMHPHHQAMAQHAMFQQQHQIMQQQVQMMMAQQQIQQQRQQMQPLVSDILNEHLRHDDVEHWHDGLEEEALRYSKGEEEIVGHEGIVDGASIEELAAAWAQAEAEYEKLAEQQEQDEDYANMFQSNESLQKHTQPYEFINKAVDEKEKIDTNWMDEGLRHFRNGDLKDAIRSFEMELQTNNPDNATAWRMLGRCHAENDMDPEAIKCLEAAVDRDPYSPESLLALGVSYVNELDHDRALENMKAWFTHNPKYAGMELPNDIYGATNASQDRSAFEEVKQLLLAALAFDATDAGDVQEALGVIYNVIKDYDAAAESLQKALETRPNDYQLWNKLGATLANGSRSDQALPAYHRALQLKPKYARAWLNMAISHSNLQDHDEAARCYLQTLSLNPGAKHCWTYLRMALSCAERWDLLPLCFSQDLAAFQEHYDFICE